MDDTDRGWSEPALDTALDMTNGGVAIVKGDANAAAPAANAANADASAPVLEGTEPAEDAPPDTVASRALALEAMLGVAPPPPVSVVEPHAPTQPHPLSDIVVPAPEVVAASPSPEVAAASPSPDADGAAASPSPDADAPSPAAPEPAANVAARSAEVAAALLAAQAVVDALPPAEPKLEAAPAPKAEAGPSPTLVPRPAATTPYVSIPPPATVPSVGVLAGAALPGYSSAPPVVVTRARSGSPVAITDADLADELRAPGMFASFGGAKPGGSWLALGGLVVLAAFGGGLALGRGTAPSPPPPVPVPAAVAAPAPEPSPPAAPPTTVTEASPSAADPSAPNAAAASASVPTNAPPAGQTLAAAVEANLGAASKDARKEGSASTFNVKAAKTNLELSAGRASKCHVAGDPAGAVTAAVTFGTNGRVSDVNVTTKGFAGTKTAQCIANKLRTTRAPSFSGSPETVNAVVTLRSAR